MHKRNAFRPAACEMLEDRLLLSRAGDVLNPFNPVRQLKAIFNIDQHKKATAAATVGALGDSYTDEYKFYPPDQTHARNWVEILSATRGVSFGKFTEASRGEPRNQGFATNWARYGATSTDMVQNQLPGLAAQVAAGQVKYVSIFVGDNDFGYFLRDASQGKIAPDQALPTLGQVGANAARNIITAIDALLAANPKVKLVVYTLPDVSLLPQVQAGLTTPQFQALAQATGQAIQAVNAAIANHIAGGNRIALVDLATQSTQLAASPTGTTTFGGATINLTTPGDDYHNFFLADGVHVGTVAQGIIADDFIHAVDTTFGAKIKSLTPGEIVRFARTVQVQTQHGGGPR